jgi:hypothetical protein
MIDIDQWFKEHGIEPLWGRMIVSEIHVRYPHLYAAAKKHEDVLSELELIDLIHKAATGVFPAHRPQR